MDVAMTPEEKAKNLIARQDEEERERERKLRRLKELEGMAFLTFAKIRAEMEKNEKKPDNVFGKLIKDFFRQHAQQTQMFNKKMLDSVEKHEKAVSDFVLENETKAEMDTREVLMKATEFDATEYCTLAMADFCRRIENKEYAEEIFTGKQPTEKMLEQRKESVKRANEALLDFSKGNVKKMEKTLKEGLLNACHAFTHNKEALCAIHWSKQINNILSVITAHPVLFKEGPNTPLLEAATGMAAMGRVMENGLKALDELCSAKLNGVQLTVEKEQNLQAQILLMQDVNVQRAAEKYQKLFAKEYHPKKGLDENNLNALLNKLKGGKAMQTLSEMESEERLFALSDPESRRTLCSDLFAPAIEKNISEEKKPGKEISSLHR